MRIAILALFTLTVPAFEAFASHEFYANCRMDYRAIFTNDDGTTVTKPVQGPRVVIDYDDKDKRAIVGWVADTADDPNLPSVSLRIHARMEGHHYSRFRAYAYFRTDDSPVPPAFLGQGLGSESIPVMSSLDFTEVPGAQLIQTKDGGKIQSAEIECRITTSDYPLPLPVE